MVLNIGCDKTTPALLMAAATVNIPAIALSVGPMLNGWWKGERAGSGTVIWKAREQLAAGEISTDEFMEIAAASAPSVGYCNTMGTATTMNLTRRGLWACSCRGLRRFPRLTDSVGKFPIKPVNASSRWFGRT